MEEAAREKHSSMIDPKKQAEAVTQGEWIASWFQRTLNGDVWNIPAMVMEHRELIDEVMEHGVFTRDTNGEYVVLEVASQVIYARIEYEESKPDRRRKRYEITNHYTHFFVQIGRRDGFGCAVCGEPSRDLGVDHIIPLVAGGTNDLDNLQLLCRSCNSKKGGTAEHSYD